MTLQKVIPEDMQLKLELFSVGLFDFGDNSLFANEIHGLFHLDILADLFADSALTKNDVVVGDYISIFAVNNNHLNR